MSEDEYQKRLLVETKRLRTQNEELLQQRNTSRQLAYDLAAALKLIGPLRCRVSPEIWKKTELAIKQMKLARGIGGYEFPADHLLDRDQGCCGSSPRSRIDRHCGKVNLESFRP
jgi:hypothetical protein